MKKAFICPIVLGIIFILYGFSIKIPGTALTTSETLDGCDTDYYVMDNKYSAIDEYVGGDAYNYEIGASLIAGKIAGTMISKNIFIVSGAICICFGITMIIFMKDKKQKQISQSVDSDTHIYNDDKNEQ